MMRDLIAFLACFLFLLVAVADQPETKSEAHGLAALREPFSQLIEKYHRSLPENMRDIWRSSAVLDALKQGHYEMVITLLKAPVRAHPENPALADCYRIIADCYRRMGQETDAESWTRRRLDLLRKAMAKERNRPESVVFLQMYRRVYAELSQSDESEYRAVTAYFLEQAEWPAFSPYRDFVLLELGRLEFARENYDEALRRCDEVDAWYKTIPLEERDRLLTDTLRARVWQKQGKVEQAASLLEELAASPRAGGDSDMIAAEAAEMRAIARRGASMGEGQKEQSSSEALMKEGVGFQGGAKLVTPKDASAKGCGGQHSAGCATGTGGGCGAVKVTESQGAGCGCGSGGCGGTSAHAPAKPSVPKPVAGQDDTRTVLKDSPTAASAGASCCSSTTATPHTAPKVASGCGHGCGCGCGAASPARKAPRQPQAPAPAAKCEDRTFHDKPIRVRNRRRRTRRERTHA